MSIDPGWVILAVVVAFLVGAVVSITLMMTERGKTKQDRDRRPPTGPRFP